MSGVARPSRLAKRRASVGFRSRAKLELRIIDLNTDHFSKELLERPIREVEDNTASHTKFALKLLLFDVCEATQFLRLTLESSPALPRARSEFGVEY